MEEIIWSDWLDFSLEQTSKVPESSGVYMMHAAMKILYIGGTSNLKQSLVDAINTVCVCDAKRFRYFVTNNYNEIAEKLLTEYKEKHDGNLPKCM